MLSHPLLPKLKQLRLSGIAGTLDERAAQAAANAIRPVDFLALLLEDELDRRQQTRHDRFVRRAGFQEIKLLADFDFGAAPTLDRSLVMAMATCQFIRDHDNWILCGPTGVGKSHLAAAIGYEAIKLGYTVLWVSAHEMLADLFQARADDSYRRKFRTIASVDLLVIDDFGLRPVAEQGAQDLYDVIQKRYERGSIVLTSNRAPAEWDQVFGDALLASAALDRLTHHARITCLSGQSYRQRHRRSRESQAVASEEPDGLKTGQPDEADLSPPKLPGTPQKGVKLRSEIPPELTQNTDG
jgi:DNA replication protein DnaC